MKGMQVELYSETNYKGKKWTFNKYEANFTRHAGLNDKISSMKVMKIPPNYCVTLYADINYKGTAKKICNEVANFVKIGWNDKFSSAKVPKGIKVDLYWDTNYKGKKLTLDRDSPNFVKIGWNDKASSSKVYKPKKQNKPKPKPKLKADPAPGTYTIVNTNANKCLDVSGASKKQDTKIIIYKCHGGTNQDYEIKYNKQNQATITAVHSKMVLTVENASKNNGGKIVQWLNKNKDNQQFTMKKQSGIYNIINVRSGKCITVSKGGTKDSTGVEQVNILFINLF